MRGVLWAARILLAPVAVFFTVVLVQLIVAGEFGAAVFGLATLMLVTVVYWWPLATFMQRREAVRREHAVIAARADAQHDAYLHGDPYGTFGNHPPTIL